MLNSYDIMKIVFVLLLGVAIPFNVSSATFTVDSILDAVDSVPGDGACETLVARECTLRAAIQETNALSGSDTINLPPSNYRLTLTGAGEQAGDLNITGDLTIIGADKETTIIDGGGIDRVFQIGTRPPPGSPTSNILVSISDLTVTNGRPGNKHGAGIFSHYADVTLNNLIVSNNISNIDGGGILNTRGSMTIIRTTVRNNEGRDGCGGIFNMSHGSLSILESTISENLASGTSASGGGICSSDYQASLVVVNSTISGNTAGSHYGGMISAGYSGVTVIKNSAFVGNAASAGGAFVSLYDTVIGHTLLSDNLPTNCQNGQTGTSLGNNLDSDGTCGLNAPSDLISVDPVIGPLSNNGGPTETHALLTGSPAIDGGVSNCTDANGQPLLIGQRGEPRPVDGDGDNTVECDIGPFEVQPAVTFIDIDIKPKRQTNRINPDSPGSIPVAVLTSSDFDALLVNPDTVEFGPAGAAKKHRQAHVQDVDKDGDMDLLFHFSALETNIHCGDTDATLTGQLWDSTPISGTDSVNPVGCQ